MIKQQGMSLLELLLALAIAAALTALSLNVYYSFSTTAEEAQLAGKVDTLFQAMSHYYQANCRQQTDYATGTALSPGALDPVNSPVNPTVLSIATNLVTPGFLTGWQPTNPLVDNTSTGGAGLGYFVQFNKTTTTTGSVNACQGAIVPPDFNPACTSGNITNQPFGTLPAGTANVIIWTAQVAVKLNAKFTTPAQWQRYANDLNASCISTTSGGGIAPCSPTPAANGYLVWTRTAAYVSNNSSDHWGFMPTIKEFNQQYTNDSMALLVNAAKTGTINTTNYLCGE